MKCLFRLDVLPIHCSSVTFEILNGFPAVPSPPLKSGSIPEASTWGIPPDPEIPWNIDAIRIQTRYIDANLLDFMFSTPLDDMKAYIPSVDEVGSLTSEIWPSFLPNVSIPH